MPMSSKMYINKKGVFRLWRDDHGESEVECLNAHYYSNPKLVEAEFQQNISSISWMKIGSCFLHKNTYSAAAQKYPKKWKIVWKLCTEKWRQKAFYEGELFQSYSLDILSTWSQSSGRNRCFCWKITYYHFKSFKIIYYYRHRLEHHRCFHPLHYSRSI